MTGVAFRASITAKPIRWVKLTLPALPVRLSWLLRMRRLTSSKRAGTTRKLVAVGMSRLAVMLATMRPAAPRSGVLVSGGRPSAPTSAGTARDGRGRSGPRRRRTGGRLSPDPRGGVGRTWTTGGVPVHGAGRWPG